MVRILITESQYKKLTKKFLNEEETDILSYYSRFFPSVNIMIVFKDYDDYNVLEPLFDEYGYGFYSPEDKTIIINGEEFIDSNLTFDDLAFVEAHEVSHLILNHNGPRSNEDEIEADLGAYILLQKHNIPTDRLVDEFYNRHGVNFDEKLTKKVSKKLKQTNESILDWDLHQKLMEKKYGKRPIQKEYNISK